MANPLVSVIVTNYNGKGYLANCLDSVLKNQYPHFELILVDNASTDDSLKAAKDTFGSDPRLIIIRNTENLGFSGGNNVGFDFSKGEYIVFLNNDTIVDGDWLVTLVDAMQNDHSIGLAQSKILVMDGGRVQTVGLLFSNYLVRKHSLGENFAAATEFQPVFEVPIASGASMIARRALIEELGLFDPKVPFFYDDTLLSFKVWLSRKRVVTVEKSKVRHMMGAASAWNVEKTTFNLLRARICLMFDVYFRLDQLAWAAFINVTHIFINSLFALRQKNLPVIYANMHGFAWTLSSLGYLWRNRLSHWSRTKVSPEALKQKFVRIRVPVAFYFFPSKLGNDCFKFAVGRYEHQILKD